MSLLFEPLGLRSVRFRNRAWMSPMCQYSAVGGVVQDWHRVHYISRAVGGAGMVMVEATAVTAEGRISPGDLGLWNADQLAPLRQIAAGIRHHGAVAGIQLAHAGRKASTRVPWEGGTPLALADGGWRAVAPSALPFAPDHAVPTALEPVHLDVLLDQFVHSTKLALQAGFEVLELHMAHGYLLHSFLSPLSNRRTDEYGGSLDNRLRFPLRVAQAVRAAWPAELPLLVRVSCTDWTEGGWDLPSTLEFARRLKALGVDLLDCSSGGTVPDAKPPVGPGYQTRFAAAVREQTGLASGAVGLITSPEQAEHILRTGQADAVFLGRALLRDPYWPLHAATALRGAVDDWPAPYQRARPG
jgi:2,4-dienoyl-CoA reductase-like NADH-dependent reductase (Old Yellow Enzyme family)